MLLGRHERSQRRFEKETDAAPIRPCGLGFDKQNLQRPGRVEIEEEYVIARQSIGGLEAQRGNLSLQIQARGDSEFSSRHVPRVQRDVLRIELDAVNAVQMQGAFRLVIADAADFNANPAIFADLEQASTGDPGVVGGASPGLDDLDALGAGQISHKGLHIFLPPALLEIVRQKDDLDIALAFARQQRTNQRQDRADLGVRQTRLNRLDRREG